MPQETARILSDWKARSGLTDGECARLTKLSVSAFRRQRRGRARADQTMEIVRLRQALESIDTDRWIEIALQAAEVAKTLRRRP
jgi:hypothetical protein